MVEQTNIELLSHRVRRLYAGLERTAPTTIDSIPLKVWRTNKLVGVCHDFSGGESPDDIREVLTQIAYNIAHVKDPLKKYLSDKARDLKMVERFIDGSLALKILIDIANREKHGYPSDRPSRSGKDPCLGGVGRSLRLQTGTEENSSAVYTIDPKTGQPVVMTTGGASGAVVYWGEVRDKNSAVVGDILDFARDALEDWERLFSSLDISLGHLPENRCPESRRAFDPDDPLTFTSADPSLGSAQSGTSLLAWACIGSLLVLLWPIYAISSWTLGVDLKSVAFLESPTRFLSICGFLVGFVIDVIVALAVSRTRRRGYRSRSLTAAGWIAGGLVALVGVYFLTCVLAFLIDVIHTWIANRW